MTTCTETSQIKNLECTKRIQYLTGQTNCLRNEFKKKNHLSEKRVCHERLSAIRSLQI